MKPHFKQFAGLRRFQDGVTRYNISWFAAACAFYLFLSLVPIVVLLVSALPYTSLTEELLLEYAGDVLPESMQSLVRYIMDDVYEPSAAVFSVSLLVTVWSSAKAVAALIRGMETICGKRRYTPYLKRRGMAAVYTVLFILAVLVTLTLSVLTRRAREAVIRLWPRTDALFGFLVHFRFLILILLLTAIFTALYKSVPDVRIRLAQQLPGALSAAVTWVLFARVFPLFLAWTSSYGTYGTLGTMMIAMLWMYYGMYIILLGCYLNRYLGALRPRPGDGAAGGGALPRGR